MAFFNRIKEFFSKIGRRVDDHFTRMSQLRKEKENLGGHQISIRHHDPKENFEIDEARRMSRYTIGEKDLDKEQRDAPLFTRTVGGKAVPVCLNELVCDRSGRLIPYSSVMHDPHGLSYWDLKAVLSDKLVQKHGFPPRLEMLSKLMEEKEKLESANSKKH